MKFLHAMRPGRAVGVLLLGSVWTAGALAADTGAVSHLTLRRGIIDPAFTERAALGGPVPEGAEDEQMALARAAIASNDVQRGVAILRDIIRRNPDYNAARSMAATALIQIERYREARDLLEGLLKKDPGLYAVMNNLAWLYATANDPSVRDAPRAVKLAREALLLAPADYHVWSTLSEAHFMNHDYEKSRRAAAEALRLSVLQKASSEQRRTYEEQVAKCEKAVRAFSLID